MSRLPRVVTLALALLAAQCAAAAAGEPALPDGARTRWVVAQPEEIVAWVAFDPAGVADRLPPRLRFVTVGELAAGGIGWASEHLAAHPAHRGHGVSFLEIVRAGTFSIDGRSPRWPEHGAAALWCARVAPAEPAADLGAGWPLLVLDLWVPDREYAAYMLARGHHASFGEATLLRGDDGTWHGTIAAPGLTVTASCAPAGPVSGGPSSAGAQALFPPATSTACDVVRVEFAGHRVRECAGAPAWAIAGTHPLAGGAVLAPASYQWGYTLLGGACPR